MIRVLVTGAGGPAGIAVIRSLLRRDDIEVFAADMDGWASGLYLVPVERRRIVPAGRDAGFVDATVALCTVDSIGMVISTVDDELMPLALRRHELADVGATLAAPSVETLEIALDKFTLIETCADAATVPRTRLLTAEAIAEPWDFPVIVKPRHGSGSRGVRLVATRGQLEAISPDESMIVQEHLPGSEYSVDIFASALGQIVAAVPRTRTRVDSGVSIAGRTVHDSALEDTAAAVARAIGLVGVANIQLRYNASGLPALLEVNARFPGALPLTIAAGVDIPSLEVDLFSGRTVPEHLEFRELATVRYLDDIFLSPTEVLHSVNAAHQDGLPG